MVLIDINPHDNNSNMIQLAYQFRRISRFFSFSNIENSIIKTGACNRYLPLYNYVFLTYCRIHMLEEQVKDVEVKSDERVSDEQKKYKDILVRNMQFLINKIQIHIT